MKHLLTACLLLSIFSCNTKTSLELTREKEFIDSLNLPKDSLAFYFPANSFHEQQSADSFVQNWFSSALYSFKEPVLSRGFVGYNIYRFLWLRSFDRPVVISLYKNQEKIFLNTKILDREPQFDESRIGGISNEDRAEYIKEGYVVDKVDSNVFVKIADRKADIVYNKSIFLNKREWEHFEQLLVKANFWNLPSTINDGSSDGANWVFEAHFKNKYHIVDYHSPGGDFKELGLFLIKLSGLKETIY